VPLAAMTPASAYSPRRKSQPLRERERREASLRSRTVSADDTAVPYSRFADSLRRTPLTVRPSTRLDEIGLGA